MKKTTVLAAALLSTAILGAQVAAAAEEPLELDTKAHVKFITDEDTETPVDPENPGEGGGPIDPTDPENPGGETPGTNGPLAIVFAPNFEFGEHVLATKDLNAPAYNLITASNGTVDVPHFVQVKDARGFNTGWDLSVKAEQLTAGTSKIDGAVINFGSVNHDATNGNGEVTDMMSALKLDGADEQTVMVAGNENGQGIHSLQWGTADSIASAEVTEGEETKTVKVNNDVKLFIPSKSLTMATADADYSAKLTWNLVGNPKATDSATPQSI